MKKYKVHFSITNIFSETQSEVVKLQAISKAIIGVATASAFISSHELFAFVTMIVGAVINELLSCLYFEEIK